MENEKDKKKEMEKAGGLLIAGCLLGGMAAGWYTGRFMVGMFGGLALGLILYAVVVLSSAAKK